MNAFRQVISNLSSKVPKPNGNAAGAAGKVAVLLGTVGLGGYAVLNSMYTGMAIILVRMAI